MIFSRPLFAVAAAVLALCAIVAPSQAALLKVAAFDVNEHTTLTTQPGFASIADPDQVNITTPFSASDSGVTLTLTNRHDQDRNRGTGGILAADPNADLLRDFHFARVNESMIVNLSGLKANTEYVVTAYSFDNGGNTNASSAWFEGSVAGLSANDDRFLTTHQNRTDDTSGADFNLRFTSSAAGQIEFSGRGAGGVPGALELAFLNGIEVFERGAFDDVINVDVNDLSTNQTEAGFVGLTLTGAGATSGSVTDNGVTVTVTTDRTDTPDRDRNNTGESLLDDFIFANDVMDITIDGLGVGTDYELEIFSLDTNGNNGQQSQWLLDGEILKTDHFNGTGTANLDAGSFSVYLTAGASSITINARNIPGRAGDLLFLSGLSLRESADVPEPTTAVLGLMGIAGLVGRRRRAA